MNNMSIWEQVQHCPDEALTTIQGGKLKGKSDISPIWRYKQLTGVFGPAGYGWEVTDEDYSVLDGANGEKVVICRLKLSFLCDGEWSDPIPGQGGAMLIATEKGQLVTNDEAFKMAYTDAISVACKQLGFAADVYWSKGSDSKYQKWTDEDPLGAGGTENKLPPRKMNVIVCAECGHPLTKAQADLSTAKYHRSLCPACQAKEAANA